MPSLTPAALLETAAGVALPSSWALMWQLKPPSVPRPVPYPLVHIRFASPAGHSSVSGKFLKYRSSIEELNVLILKRQYKSLSLSRQAVRKNR